MHDHFAYHFWWPFLSLLLIFAFVLAARILRHRERMSAIETARRLAEAKTPMPPEIASALQPERRLRESTPERDLRSGVFLLSIAAAFVVLAAVLSYNHMGPPGIHPLYGVAAFPGILGLARLLLWRFGAGRTGT